MRALVLLAIPFAIVACDTPKPPRETTTTSQNTQAVEASWPSSPDAAVLAALDAESRAAVSRSPVPVLVPNRPELLKVGKVMVEDNWYAFAATHDGLTVSVGASRVEHRYPDVKPEKGKHVVRGVAGFVTRNESIWSASWPEHGVHYSLDVECGEPTDPRCADDTLVLELARDLVFIGGKGGKGGVK